MALDEELFFARRLGYGLKQGETIGGSVRDWAIKQISEVPPLDFYGPDGQSIRSTLPPYAEPVADYAEATRLVGIYFNKEHELEKLAGTMPDAQLNEKIYHEVDLPQKWYPEWRDALLRSLTIVNGPSPVFERFWLFWVNHFSVKSEQMTALWYGPHTRLIRSHMTGKFSEMLRDAILQPAMVYYLDNFVSIGPHSISRRAGTAGTVNENLARELLELHTMSPAGGYTQQDVVQLSYALSGWQFFAAKFDDGGILKTPPPFGSFFFFDKHEPGNRSVLGKTYDGANKGKDQAPQIITDLAVNPATAEFISRKLLRHFLADDPPDDSVANVHDAWVQSGGDLPTIHAAVIDEVLTKGHEYEKFSTPEIWFHQLHRTASLPVPTFLPKNSGVYWINLLFDELGQGYGSALQPNGYSDLKADWISKELLERRARYANLAARRINEEALAYLGDFGVRLAGPDSDLVAAMKQADNPAIAATVLLASPQFMRI